MRRDCLVIFSSISLQELTIKIKANSKLCNRTQLRFSKYPKSSLIGMNMKAILIREQMKQAAATAIKSISLPQLLKAVTSCE